VSLRKKGESKNIFGPKMAVQNFRYEEHFAHLPNIIGNKFRQGKMVNSCCIHGLIKIAYNFLVSINIYHISTFKILKRMSFYKYQTGCYRILSLYRAS